MRRLGWVTLVCVPILATGACKNAVPSLSDDGPERGCVLPKLTVVGHARQHGPLTVRPGETVRLRGVHYTDDCAANRAGAGVAYPRLQLLLQSTYRIGPVATVHPKGADASFTVAVTIPSTTVAGPAKISAAGIRGGHLRLVVRR
jgi:hypothetical protein